MKCQQLITLTVLLFPLAMRPMNFEQDNPEDKVVRRRCAWELRKFHQHYSPIGRTPLNLYDACIQFMQLQERVCQEHPGMEELYDCTQSRIQAYRCNALYKKAIEIVHNCDPGSLEKELREAEDQDSWCKDSCLDMQKKCYLSNEFLLSTRYAGGPDNRERLCGIFNYLGCRTECTVKHEQLKVTIKQEWQKEKQLIEDAEYWNQQAKQKYNNPKV